MTGRRISLAFLLTLCLIVCPRGAESAEKALVLSLPGIDWAVKVKADGFAVDIKLMDPGGQGVRFLALNQKTGMVVSGRIEKAEKPGTAKEARDYFWNKALKAPVDRGDVTMSDFGDMAVVEYMVRRFRGALINQRNLYACQTKDRYRLYVHLSKANFHQDEEPQFRKLLESIALEDKNPTGSIQTTYRVSKAPHFLTLIVPETWQDEIRHTREAAAPTLHFRPKGLPVSEIRLKPIWSTGQETGFNSPDNIRQAVEDSGKKALPKAVEKELVMRDLKGKSASGSYYTLTDKTPDIKPGEFKFVTQGGVGVGKLLVMFTIFTNEKDSAVVPAALEMLGNAFSKP